jgi:signal transduction histidine kinase
MSSYSNLEQSSMRFFQNFRRMLLACVALAAILLALLTYNVLKDNPAYMHDWRGITCILLAVVALALYALPVLIGFEMDYPPPLPYALSVGGGMYLVVSLLTLINNNFSWVFYIAIGMSMGLFTRRRLVLVACVIMLTMFAFQDLFWPLNTGSLVGLISEALPAISMVGFFLLFQNLLQERQERNALFKQLAQANTELEEAHQQLEQSVAQQQELAILRERGRLAREMHDTIGHALVLISVKLEAAQRLRTRDPARCDRELESTKEIARGTMTTLRASIANLRSPALEREQLYHALRRSADELALRTGLHVACMLPAESENLSEAVTETLWKVSQEALTNIEKHARANNVEIEVSRQGAQLCLRIHDDGIGLPAAFCQLHQEEPLVDKGHYGLRGMRERVEAIGGQLTLQSAQGQGTTVEIRLPL